MRKFLYVWIVSLAACVWIEWLILSNLPDGRLHAYFLDVGQGDSTLLKLPHGGTVLIDGGPGSNIVEPLRRALGWMSNEIDLVVVTHFDRDHCEGLLKVFEDYRVGRVLITGVEQRTELQKNLFALISAKKIPVWIASSDSDIVLDSGDANGDGSVIMDVLWPFDALGGRYYKNANETSIVARLLIGDGVNERGILVTKSKVLMTGDIGFETEKKLVTRYGKSGELRAEILKVPHHGSRYSSGEDFLSRVRATWAVIMVSAKNTYGHPHPDALERLEHIIDVSHILRTDKKGTIEMEL